MKSFTSTQLRTSSNDVYNEVLKQGQAKIEHRDRPDMILIDADKLKELEQRLVKNQNDGGVLDYA